MIKTLAKAQQQERVKFRVPRSVQDAIPIRRIWSDGIFLCGNILLYPNSFGYEMGMDTAGCRAYNRNHIVRDAVVAPSSIIFSSAEELAREVMPILCVPHGVRNLSFFLFWRIFIQMEIFFFITYNYIKHIASRNRPTYNTVLFI